MTRLTRQNAACDTFFHYLSWGLEDEAILHRWINVHANPILAIFSANKIVSHGN
jgi:hypothetical protein